MKSNSTPKSHRLLQIARATLDRGGTENEVVAREMAVLALRSEDAMDALDKLLPKVPEPEMREEDFEENLEETQVAQIRAMANELVARKKDWIAKSILARLDQIDEAKKRRRAKTQK
jgi:hypothetical protein